MINRPLIPLSKPDIRNDDITRAVNVFKSGMLVQGKEVKKLENNISSFIGTKYASAVSNGTASLQLALLALGIGANDEVIVPAFSYVATANVVELVGAKCVFIDINDKTFNIDENNIIEKIKKKTKAIIPVHEFGLSANMTKIMSIAKTKNIKVIEDAACALGAKWNHKAVGSFGDFGSFSFHPRKAITSGEGGILTTNNMDFDLVIKTLRNHGINPKSFPVDFVKAGYNYRMTDFQAALVRSQFLRLRSILENKKKIAELYFKKIKNSAIILPFIPDGSEHTWQSFHIVLQSKIERDKLQEYLKYHGIFTNYGAQCIPAMSYYQKTYKYMPEKEFPNAWKAYTCGLALPIYNKLSIKDIKYIIRTLNNFK